MKKISYYLIFIVVIASILVSFWTYQRYFKDVKPDPLLFKVEKGSIREVVKVRGEVVPQKDFDLEFPFSGTVQEVFIKEGQLVDVGDPLVKLETNNLDIEVKTLNSKLAQSEANLKKLTAGATKEELKILETKEINAKISLTNAGENFIDKLKDAHAKSDDAVRTKTAGIFSGYKTSVYQFTYTTCAYNAESDARNLRLQSENVLDNWKNELDALKDVSDSAKLKATSKSANANMTLFTDLFSNINATLVTGCTATDSSLDTYRTNTAVARTNINIAITNLRLAEDKFTTSESNLALAEDELNLLKTGTRSEDIEIAKAQIEEIKNSIAAVSENIRKSTIYAPASTKVVKIWLEPKETANLGQVVISLSMIGHKIQVDISELEIGKIREIGGSEVLVKLDAFPDLELKGKIISIEPREIIKESDKYYRANVYIEPHDSLIRSGMNADLIIPISTKDGVLKIPELAVYQKNDKKFTIVLSGVEQKEIEIETGISDGASVEITNGLIEGQTVVVSAE
ncbi:MAG: HlyD family efflux transporter periplasmic adaptor subunit [bacterium]|nr:HlyD family efflux transporter periplasmic adaptor subunit [bacterium]